MEKQTIRIPIIGRSSSGKTSLTKELEQRGYNVIHEVARGVLEERKNISLTKEEKYIRQTIISSRQKDLEDSVFGLAFLDRSLIDGFGYAQYFGVDMSFLDKAGLNSRYDFVFELEKRPFVSDEIRIEKNSREADEIYSLVRAGYINFGYKPIFVPNFCRDRLENSKQRADFILEKLRDII